VSYRLSQALERIIKYNLTLVFYPSIAKLSAPKNSQFLAHQAVYSNLDSVVYVDDVAAVESRRRQRWNVDDIVVEGVVAGLHFAAGDAEYIALAAVFRRLGPHLNYLR